MRGRKPKPTALKLLEGNPGRRRLNPDEPKPELNVPCPPAHLTHEAKREWDRISGDLHDLGLLSRIDRAALAAYCMAWSRWVEAEEVLKEQGVVVRSPTGFPIQSPHLAIANKALAQMRAFLTEFGMTPSSRTRIHAEKPVQGDGPLEEFLKGR